ncbi:MAG: 4-hydroxybenzoate octaprenyltransferase [Rickettsiales bacterium]|nr:4-hydroxybenzoate octaprenyltransferase [Rickettsiales bacterium]|tara:strand:+ start:52858 stop:53730 length:873 start_codon:yes stop_codon:yes gene_type:complete
MLSFFDFQAMKSRFLVYVQLGRYDKPTGAFLLYLPCCWGLALTSFTTIEISLYMKFLLGSFLMRGAGCTINDFFDRSFDNLVERTKSRPIASGKVKPRDALIFLCFQLLVSFLILLTFKPKTILISLSITPFIFLYPLAKRVTAFPQVMLGIIFNWGVLVSSIEVTGKVSQAALIVYLIGVIWTVFYDTIYAFQDMEDDRKIGVNSLTFVIFDYKKIFFLFLLSLMTILWVWVGCLSGAGLVFYIIVLVTLTLLAKHVIKLNLGNKKLCGEFFKMAPLYGTLFYFLMLWS